SDLERVTEALTGVAEGDPWTAQPAVVRTLAPLARASGWRLRVYTRAGGIVGLAARGRRACGAASALGTTKVAGYLIDLENGETLARAGVMNPQIGYGEDLITRLAWASERADHARQLAHVVRGALGTLLGDLAASAGVTREQVVDACVV